MAYLKPRDAQPIAIHLPKQHQIFEAGDKYTVHTTTQYIHTKRTETFSWNNTCHYHMQCILTCSIVSILINTVKTPSLKISILKHSPLTPPPFPLPHLILGTEKEKMTTREKTHENLKTKENPCSQTEREQHQGEWGTFDLGHLNLKL